MLQRCNSWETLKANSSASVLMQTFFKPLSIDGFMRLPAPTLTVTIPSCVCVCVLVSLRRHIHAVWLVCCSSRPLAEAPLPSLPWQCHFSSPLSLAPGCQRAPWQWRCHQHTGCPVWRAAWLPGVTIQRCTPSVGDGAYNRRLTDRDYESLIQCFQFVLIFVLTMCVTKQCFFKNGAIYGIWICL